MKSPYGIGTKNVSIESGIVEKTFSNQANYNSEVHHLNKLADFHRVPNIIELNDEKMSIKMTYVGEPISRITIPEDWRHQCNDILDGLQKYNCVHGDLEENVTVLNGKLHIIDFANSYKDEWGHKGDEYLLFLHIVCVHKNFKKQDLIDLSERKRSILI